MLAKLRGFSLICALPTERLQPTEYRRSKTAFAFYSGLSIGPGESPFVPYVSGNPETSLTCRASPSGAGQTAADQAKSLGRRAASAILAETSWLKPSDRLRGAIDQAEGISGCRKAIEFGKVFEATMKHFDVMTSPRRPSEFLGTFQTGCGYDKSVNHISVD